MTGRRFAIQQQAISHGDDARAAVDGETPACIVVQRVRNCVRRRIAVEGVRDDADDSAVRCVFIDRVDGRVGVCDCRRVKFVDVDQIDRVALRDKRAVGRGRQDRDAVTDGRFAIQ